ncbi:hypothetical protein M8J77_021372 [Diaphorina citri]|nr:hypothetical protein M8J77_021372 [Diaphorina citri]
MSMITLDQNIAPCTPSYWGTTGDKQQQQRNADYKFHCLAEGTCELRAPMLARYAAYPLEIQAETRGLFSFRKRNIDVQFPKAIRWLAMRHLRFPMVWYRRYHAT